MTCPVCRGARLVVETVPVLHPRDIDCNDWEAVEHTCDGCGGTGEVADEDGEDGE